MKIKVSKDHLLITIASVLLGYYLTFVYAHPIENFLYIFMPVMNSTKIVDLYARLAMGVIGGVTGYLLYGVLKMKIGRHKIIKAGLAGVAAFILVILSFSVHTRLYLHEQNSKVMNYFSMNLRDSIRFIDKEGSGQGTAKSITLREGNSELKIVSSEVGGMKPKSIKNEDESAGVASDRRTAGNMFFLSCNYTILGKSDTRFLRSTGEGITERVKGNKTAYFEGERLEKYLAVLIDQYTELSKITDIKYADYTMYFNGGTVSVQKDKLEPLKKALNEKVVVQLPETEKERYAALMESGIKEADEGIFALIFMNSGKDFRVEYSLIYDSFSNILVMGRNGPYYKAYISEYLK